MSAAEPATSTAGARPGAVPVELIAEGHGILSDVLDALDQVAAVIAAYNTFSDKTRAARPERESIREDDALGELWARATRLWDIDSALMVIAGTVCDATGSVPGDEPAIAPSVLRTALGIAPFSNERKTEQSETDR